MREPLKPPTLAVSPCKYPFRPSLFAARVSAVSSFSFTADGSSSVLRLKTTSRLHGIIRDGVSNLTTGVNRGVSVLFHAQGEGGARALNPSAAPAWARAVQQGLPAGSGSYGSLSSYASAGRRGGEPAPDNSPVVSPPSQGEFGVLQSSWSPSVHVSPRAAARELSMMRAREG